ncbi:hypothetical protein DPMN_170848 [Dreissena polymorpha]|uniref:Uncharacterized protein n=1 Tax=Dreissena polymorpha TaxID=45954 RepID=A0A9D4E012_DREPO|nr:hypothetical protein DPMN_170848 [Dreissena polymorpha]
MPALQRGCSQNLTVLKLSRVAYSKKKECVVQTSFKQFFSSAYTLKHVELANVKLPPDAIKYVLNFGMNFEFRIIYCQCMNDWCGDVGLKKTTCSM